MPSEVVHAGCSPTASSADSAAKEQLALFDDREPASTTHTWAYYGQEQKPPHARIDACLRCFVRRRTVRRFTRPLVTYARRGNDLFVAPMPPGGGPKP